MTAEDPMTAVAIGTGKYVEFQMCIRDRYNRNDMDIQRATFRVRGDVVEVYPAQGGDYLIRIEFFGDEIDRIAEIRQPALESASCCSSSS